MASYLPSSASAAIKEMMSDFNAKAEEGFSSAVTDPLV
jgi:hypothetical protein